MDNMNPTYAFYWSVPVKHFQKTILEAFAVDTNNLQVRDGYGYWLFSISTHILMDGCV